jgi:uncharacterized coiled-coil protein SlyX
MRTPRLVLKPFLPTPPVVLAKQEGTIAQQENDIKGLSELKAIVAKQQATITTLASRLQEQAKQIERVSTKIQLSEPGPKAVANNQ